MDTDLSSSSKRHEPLYQAVFSFDRSLSHPVLQKLEPGMIGRLLQDLEKFYHQAQQQQLSLRHACEPSESHRETRQLIAAGCRLSSDLNEALISKLVDTAQGQDAAIAELSRQLSQQLIARNQTNQLLKKAQSVRQQTVETAELAGLGLVI